MLQFSFYHQIKILDFYCILLFFLIIYFIFFSNRMESDSDRSYEILLSEVLLSENDLHFPGFSL